MDAELRDALGKGFGPEPPHPPVAERLTAGHRAVRRRRVAGAVVTVAAAAAVGIAATALAGGAPDRNSEVATEQTSSPDPQPEPWDASELVRYSDSGMVEVRPGVTVLQRIDEPLGDPTEFNHSVALAVEFQGAESWLILDWWGPRLRDHDRAEPYVRRVTVRANVDESRRPWRRERPAYEEPSTLVDALQQLPAMQRKVVVLRHMLDLSVAQTASELGIGEGTVKSHSSRGLTALGNVLARTAGD